MRSRLATRRPIWIASAIAVVVGGYVDLWYGGTRDAAWLLTLGYLVAVPLALCAVTSDANDASRNEEPVPYWLGAVVSLTVVVMYAATLAPTTGLWDASEYIAVARVLGIPHAPGNPLFVLIAHAFGSLPLPMSYAARINLLSATASALAAGLWAMSVHRLLRRWSLPAHARALVSMLTALLGATTFTIWNQSVISEKVYGVGLFGIALASWLALRWIDAPVASRRSDTLFVLAFYACALGFANHTAGLLPVPALIVVLVLRRPATLQRRRALLTATVALAVGFSPFLFEPIRAAQRPLINEGSPTACVNGPQLSCIFSAETWDRVRGTIERDQYGGHPIMTRASPWTAQYSLWWSYFRWQWWRDGLMRHTQWQSAVAVLFALLIAVGAIAHWRRDRASFAYIGPLIVTLTPGLIYYLNLKYGPTQQPELGASVLREGADRDYFFVWSFSSLTLWIGLGVATTWSWCASQIERLVGDAGDSIEGWRAQRAWLATAPLLLLTLLPAVGNYRQASRRGQTLAREWAADVLLSLEPYAVLITNGDNDTFPLWYAQLVEGMRQDVTVVLAPYLNAGWYVRQLQQTPVHPYLGDGIVAYGALGGRQPMARLWSLSDAQLAAIPQEIDPGSLRQFNSGTLHSTLPPGGLRRDQFLVLQLIHDAFPTRPIYFSVGNYAQTIGLGDLVVTQGMLHRLLPQPARDDARFLAYPGGYLDVERSRDLWLHYRGEYTLYDEATLVDAIPSDIPTVYDVTLQLLAWGLSQRGDSTMAQRLLREHRALLSTLSRLPSPALHAAN